MGLSPRGHEEFEAAFSGFVAENDCGFEVADIDTLAFLVFVFSCPPFGGVDYIANR